MNFNAFLFSIFFFGMSIAFAQEQNQIKGTIVDTQDIPLSGASIVIKGSNEGTVADFDGKFILSTNRDYPITLIISYVGHKKQSLVVEGDGVFQIQLSEEGMFDEVVISASRKAEKLQEAPAAVSVLDAKELSSSGGSVAPVRALINIPGVELQQQTGQRINIALRSGSDIFTTDVFPMLDYRSLITPGVGYFDSQNSPVNNIDLERVEVVLGPGSALYGPDVTSGVVHFISKNPFDYPGTTAELIYGERNTFKTAVRNAGQSVNGKFGYKINARYGSGEDFTLDPNNAEDQKILSKFKTEIRSADISPKGAVDTSKPGTLLLNTKQEQVPNYWAAAVNSSLYFRPVQGMEIVAAGGWNAGKAIFYNNLGEGMNFSNEYWAQARFNYNGWFAQAYYIHNDGGNDKNPVYLNRTGFITPLERKHLESQLQYNFDLPEFLNSEWTTGIDFRNVTANSENSVYGRNENNDDYRILGGYVQAKLKPHEKIDIFIAGRYDGYNFTDEKTFSPRVAVVYKPNKNHNIRLSYNKAANPVPATSLYFDLPAQQTPAFDVWVMGAIKPYTFGSNPEINWLIPGVPNTSYKDGFPLSATYKAVNEGKGGVIAQIPNHVKNPQLASLLAKILQNGTLEGYSSVGGADISGENELLPVDYKRSLISTLEAYEFGYKGLFWERFSVGFNVYYLRREGNSSFTQVSPAIHLKNLPTDLGEEVQKTFQPQIKQQLIALGQNDATATATAAKVGQVLNTAYTSAGEKYLKTINDKGLPFHGIIPTQEAPESGSPKLIYGFPIVDSEAASEDWGFEINTKYFFSDNLSAFGNYTRFNNISENPWDLNFPQNKIRVGMNYQPESGFKSGISYQWDQNYISNNTTYRGSVDAKSLVDVMVGYDFGSGITLEVSGTNILNNKFRALPGFPQIGRTITGRLLYHF